MADQKKISELPPAGSVEDGDLVPVVQGLDTYKQTALNFKNYVLASTGEFSGSAAKLTVARTISMTGDGTWAVSFDGSDNATGVFSLSTVSVSDGGTGATSPVDARLNLGVRNTSTRFLDGLDLVWGVSSISASPGGAYIPSLGRALEVSAALSLSLTGLTSGTFYHVYLFESSGVPALELSATAPLAAATGGFVKTGDTSRRYIGSVLASGTTSVYKFVHSGNRMDYNANVAGAAVFNFTGAAITATNVSVATAVPPTSTHAAGDLLNSSTTAGTTLRIANSDIGTVAPALYRRLVFINSMSPADILLSSTQTFSYIFDATPSSGFSLRVTGYTFRR